MLAEIANWNIRHVTDGIALQPPTGEGGIRLLERQPMTSVAATIAHARAQMASFEAIEVSTIERITTNEGEYAAVWGMTASHGRKRLHRAIGLVWGDHTCTRIDGATTLEEWQSRFRDAVRALTIEHALGLGTDRRRRYLYRSPAGWQGYARGLTEIWFPPDYPGNDALIHVFAARVAERHTTRASILDRELHEMSWLGFVEERTEEPVHLAQTLHGAVWHVVGRYRGGPRRFIDVAVVEDMRFHYVARLETDRRDHAIRRQFLDLVRSIEPLPSTRRESSPLHAHYVD